MYFYGLNKNLDRALYSTHRHGDWLIPTKWWLYPEFCCPTIQLMNQKFRPKVSYYSADR
jgi:hypothetical protein